MSVVADNTVSRLARPDAAQPQSVFSHTDYWRCSPATMGGRGGHKEWSYFCILARDFDLLVNFSLIDPATTTPDWPRGVPRLVVLAKERNGQWVGDLEHFGNEDVRVTPGEMDVTFGSNSLMFNDEHYELKLNLCNKPVNATVRLLPCMRPAVASSVRLSNEGAMRWLVVPRLLASGTVSINNRDYSFEKSLAYHDRNWGHFRWGGDFSWEWAAILPDSTDVPWSLVYMRIGDRSRNRTFSQGVIVWRHDEPCRTFHGRDLSIDQSNLQRQHNVLRIPAIVSLATPGTSADVPGKIDINAQAGSDALEISLELDNLAQIGIPNDRIPGLTLLSETGGRATVKGSVHGQPIEFCGRTVVEFNHAGR